VKDTLDLGVTIEHVRVRTAALETGPAPVFVAGYGGAYAGARPGDHRIVIHELCIEIEAALDASDAHGLARQLASELAARLAELQDQRQSRASAPATGPIHVETLRLRLRGERSRHPPSQQICAALMTALQQGVRDAC
jgi:hypothetical protein